MKNEGKDMKRFDIDFNNTDNKVFELCFIYAWGKVGGGAGRGML